MWTKKLNIKNLGIAGKRVLLRVDYDVPIQNGKVANNKKIVWGLDSIIYAIMKEAKSVVIMSHLGNPRGIKHIKYSLSPVAEELNSLLKQLHKDPNILGKYSQIFKLFSSSKDLPQVRFLSDCIGSEVEAFCQDPPHGSIYMLENLRFHYEEEGCGIDDFGNKVCASTEKIKLFRESLRKLGDVYINDAFSVSHLAHSSILGQGFEEERAAGVMLSREIGHFKRAIYKKGRRCLAILGGVSIMDKLQLIDNLLDRVSEMIIGGAMAFPFLKKLKGMHIGHSLFDIEGSKLVKRLMKKAKRNRVYIHFPLDFVASSTFGAIQTETVRSGIGDGWMGLDIGPESCIIFQKIILRAKVIIWNGPLGAYELDHFEAGTESVLQDVVKVTSRGSTSILVGEDTAACVEKWNHEGNVSHISRGQAGKDVLRGKLLPGVLALSDYKINLDKNLITKMDNR